MKTLCVIFGSILLLFFGTWTIQNQEMLKRNVNTAPMFEGFKTRPLGFSISALDTVEPRRLLD